MLPYGDILGLLPYGWDLAFLEGFVEHCQQPPMGIGTDILYLLHQSTISFFVFSNALHFLYASPSIAGGITRRFDVDGMLYLPLTRS